MLGRFYFSLLVCALIGVGINKVNCTAICSNQEAGSAASNEPCFDVQSFEYSLNKKVQLEKDVELECYVNNKADYSVSWMHGNQLISVNDMVIKPDSNIKLDTDSKRKFNLKVSNVDENRKGVYRCQIVTNNAVDLEYNLEILVPPKVTRIPSESVIVLNEGDSLTVQCLTQGNPKPKLSWTKTGEKAVHTTVDDLNSTLRLENVDETHADTYSCTAKNGVGNPVTSEFQIFIRFKPRVKISEAVNIYQNVLFTSIGKQEQVKCLVDSYPAPRMSLLFNDELIPQQSYTFEENREVKGQYVLTYNLISSTETLGTYKCIAENDLGISVGEVKVSAQVSDIRLSNDKVPTYSDAIVFEWLLYSGSPIVELNVQVFSENGTNITSLVTKTKQPLAENEEPVVTYHNENILYKDFYDVTKLTLNTTYVIRMRVKNENNEWSEWSAQNLTVRTTADENEKITKHRSSSSHMHHHYKLHHDKKHKTYQLAGSRDLNGKRDKYNSYNMMDNSATSSSLNLSYLASSLLVLFSLHHLCL